MQNQGTFPFWENNNSLESHKVMDMKSSITLSASSLSSLSTWVLICTTFGSNVKNQNKKMPDRKLKQHDVRKLTQIAAISCTSHIKKRPANTLWVYINVNIHIYLHTCMFTNTHTQAEVSIYSWVAKQRQIRNPSERQLEGSTVWSCIKH